VQFPGSHEITAKRVLTDHGSCYRSQAFTEELGPHVTHKRTRPYRPLTNGTVERFNHTLAAEWAYTRTYPSGDAGSATYQHWLHHHNHHRPHTGIGGKSPIDRVSVHNAPRTYTVLGLPAMAKFHYATASFDRLSARVHVKYDAASDSIRRA